MKMASIEIVRVIVLPGGSDGVNRSLLINDVHDADRVS